MIASLIIVFREILEAGLIVGIVLAATRAVKASRFWIAGGILGGLIGSGIVAACTRAIASAFAGSGQELFNATVLAVAAMMLATHNIWMARHGRQLANEMKAAGAAVTSGAKSLVALAIVVGAAVLREGSEVVMFLYGVTIAGGAAALDLLAGGLLGIASGALVSGLMYFGLLRIPVRYFFAVTSAMIAFLAAGMAGQSVFFLEQGGISQELSTTAWNTSAVLDQSSIPGRILHTLVGYSDQPSYMQIIVYLATLGIIFWLMYIFSPKRETQASPS